MQHGKIKAYLATLIVLVSCSADEQTQDTVEVFTSIPEKCAFEIPVGIFLSIKLLQETDESVDDVIRIHSALENFANDKDLVAQAYGEWIEAKKTPPYSLKPVLNKVDYSNLSDTCSKISREDLEEIYIAAFEFATYVLVNEQKYLPAETPDESSR